MKREKKKLPNLEKNKPGDPKKNRQQKKGPYFIWLFLLAGLTTVCFLPMLRNGFTNWDDEIYVLNNSLLRGPDWKGIFFQTSAFNYHPLTILTLAANFHLSKLSPFSYLLFNLLLHVVNTLLVFYFIFKISDNNKWVAFITALLFAIHPMHVESVAWISERKDVLYTLFFLLSLIFYRHYIFTNKLSGYWFCFLFFVLSLLSKPSAMILPVVLFLLDYWHGRKYQFKLILEKIPFFVLAVLFGVITLQAQSQVAVVTLDVYPMWVRPLFASYCLLTYLLNFIIPYPLSAFHPYPSTADLGWQIYSSPLILLALIFFVWRYRKNKLVIFSLFFFVTNLLLVLQLVSIGSTIVSERYTYVPYIGLSFLVSMWLYNLLSKSSKAILWIVPALLVLIFGSITFQRTKIWKNSFTLWSDVIEHYPDAPLPRTNRANYLFKLVSEPGHAKESNSLYQQAEEDCNAALKNSPRHWIGYQIRGSIFLNQARYEKALADGDSITRLKPLELSGYSIRGKANLGLKRPKESLDDFNKCVELKPDDDGSLNNRGTTYYNLFQNYRQALVDFDRAIEISPQGNYLLNRARCYYQLGNMDKAKADVEMAMNKGMALPEEFRQLVGR